MFKLPDVEGRYTHNTDLSKTNWFQVGGRAEVLYKPKDLKDLQRFFQNKPDCKITVLGVGSNIIVRDKGIDGVVIRLGRGFADIDYTPGGDMHPHGGIIECGAATLDVNVAEYAAQNDLTGLEFLCGIPGTIGGAVAMNAGAYGSETKDFVIKVQMIDFNGKIHVFTNEKLKFKYRRCMKMYERDYIITKVWLNAEKGDRQKIIERMKEIKHERSETQPVSSRTGGSTFENPINHKAWKLIDEAGLRGHQIGGAKVSEKHCNFLINTGYATAKDLEDLIKHIQREVKKRTKIMLKPEIKLVGNI